MLAGYLGGAACCGFWSVGTDMPYLLVRLFGEDNKVEFDKVKLAKLDELFQCFVLNSLLYFILFSYCLAVWGRLNTFWIAWNGCNYTCLTHQSRRDLPHGVLWLHFLGCLETLGLSPSCIHADVPHVNGKNEKFCRRLSFSFVLRVKFTLIHT